MTMTYGPPGSPPGQPSQPGYGPPPAGQPGGHGQPPQQQGGYGQPGQYGAPQGGQYGAPYGGGQYGTSRKGFDFAAVNPYDWAIIGAGILAFILSFFKFYTASVSGHAFGQSISESGHENGWHGF